MVLFDGAKEPIHYRAEGFAEAFSISFRSVEGTGNRFIRQAVSKCDQHIDKLVDGDKDVE